MISYVWALIWFRRSIDWLLQPIQVPWSRLGQEPVLVYLDSILVLAEPATQVEGCSEDAIQEAKKNRLRVKYSNADLFFFSPDFDFMYCLFRLLLLLFLCQELEMRLLERQQQLKSEMVWCKLWVSDSISISSSYFSFQMDFHLVQIQYINMCNVVTVLSLLVSCSENNNSRILEFVVSKTL